MVPTRKVSFYLFLRAILYRLSRRPTTNMALLKISHWERLQKEPRLGEGALPLPDAGRCVPLTSTQVSPPPHSDRGCTWKEKTGGRDLGQVSVVDGRGHRFSRENSQLIPGSEVECSLR